MACGLAAVGDSGEVKGVHEAFEKAGEKIVGSDRTVAYTKSLMEAFRSDIEFLAAHEGTARTTLLKFNRDFLSRSVVEVIPDRPIEKEYLDDVGRRP